MKEINSFEAACCKLGKDPIAMYHPLEKLDIINEAIVGDWKADYANHNQKKWFPVHRYDASVSAFRFCHSYYRCARAFAGTGVRLVFETEAQADYAGEQFEKEYNEALLR